MDISPPSETSRDGNSVRVQARQQEMQLPNNSLKTYSSYRLYNWNRLIDFLLIVFLNALMHFYLTKTKNPSHHLINDLDNLQNLKTVEYLHDTVEDLTSLHGLVHKYENFLGDEVAQVAHFDELFYNFRMVEKAYSSKLIHAIASIATGEADKAKLDDLEQNLTNSSYGPKKFRQRLLTEFQRVFESIYVLETVSAILVARKSTTDFQKSKEKMVLEKYNFISAETEKIIQQYLESKAGGKNGSKWQAEKDFADTLQGKGRPEIATFVRKYVEDVQPGEQKIHENFSDIIHGLEHSATYQYIENTLADIARLEELALKYVTYIIYDKAVFTCFVREFENAKKLFIFLYISAHRHQHQQSSSGNEDAVLLNKFEQDFKTMDLGPSNFPRVLAASTLRTTLSKTTTPVNYVTSTKQSILVPVAGHVIFALGPFP